ncbi:hypothetical protein AVEN_189082-1 [Araneus ventricosus]|uniref:Uncharacterized protein n=1 Tax=Araneus ventricosus TaxID=182803 RepID=A0A4Y2ME79_ARAVE|nr:hypothetical protein AVEN_189082-1 [Araneus ventricosus]
MYFCPCWSPFRSISVGIHFEKCILARWRRRKVVPSGRTIQKTPLTSFPSQCRAKNWAESQNHHTSSFVLIQTCRALVQNSVLQYDSIPIQETKVRALELSTTKTFIQGNSSTTNIINGNDSSTKKKHSLKLIPYEVYDRI